MSRPRSRFYREAAVSAADDGYVVLLDGKRVKTPAGAALALPTAALAEAVAAEWRGQGDTMRPEAMLLTKLANTAIDQIASKRDAVVEQILAFGRSDLVCYRAEAPAALVER